MRDQNTHRDNLLSCLELYCQRMKNYFLAKQALKIHLEQDFNFSLEFLLEVDSFALSIIFFSSISKI